MKNNDKIKFRLVFNVFRFLHDDVYYEEVANFYYWLYIEIRDYLHKSKIYWFLMEEQILDD